MRFFSLSLFIFFHLLWLLCRCDHQNKDTCFARHNINDAKTVSGKSVRHIWCLTPDTMNQKHNRKIGRMATKMPNEFTQRKSHETRSEPTHKSRHIWLFQSLNASDYINNQPYRIYMHTRACPFFSHSMSSTANLWDSRFLIGHFI